MFRVAQTEDTGRSLTLRCDTRTFTPSLSKTTETLAVTGAGARHPPAHSRGLRAGAAGVSRAPAPAPLLGCDPAVWLWATHISFLDFHALFSEGIFFI